MPASSMPADWARRPSSPPGVFVHFSTPSRDDGPSAGEEEIPGGTMAMLCRTFLTFLFATGAAAVAADPIVITDRLHHIGPQKKPEWKEFTTVEPAHRSQLEFEFAARREPGEHTLELQAGDVDMDWRVRLNDEDLGPLAKTKERTTQYFSVAASSLRNGENRLRVIGPATLRRGDDIYVGKAILHDRPLREV